MSEEANKRSTELEGTTFLREVRETLRMRCSNKIFNSATSDTCY